MDPDDVQAVGAQSLQAVLDGAQGGVRAVVVDHLVGAAVLEEPALLTEVAGGGVLGLVQDDPADLGGEDVGVARVLGEDVAEPDLGEAGAVEGGGVEIADALVPGGLHGGRGLVVGDRPEHVPERCGAEAETAGEEVGDAH